MIALLSLAATFSVTVEQDQELSHAVRRSFTNVCCQHDALVFDTSMVHELLLEGGHTARSPFLRKTFQISGNSSHVCQQSSLSLQLDGPYVEVQGSYLTVMMSSAHLPCWGYCRLCTYDFHYPGPSRSRWPNLKICQISDIRA